MKNMYTLVWPKPETQPGSIMGGMASSIKSPHSLQQGRECIQEKKIFLTPATPLLCNPLAIIVTPVSLLKHFTISLLLCFKLSKDEMQIYMT